MFDRKEYMKRYNKEYSKNNLERCRESTRIWRINNSERLKETNRIWRENNIEKREEYLKQYHENYPGKIRENHRIRMNIRRKTNLKVNLNHKISGAIYKSIRNNKKGRRWESLVGYTLDKLKKYLKKTMPKGYNWKDYPVSIANKMLKEMII